MRVVGPGRLTRVLIDHGHDVTGVDASDAMLSRARSLVPQATYHAASFLQLPFPDESFDIVCCGLALTHVSLLMQQSPNWLAFWRTEAAC